MRSPARNGTSSLGSESKLGRRAPGAPFEGDRALVARQAVKVGTEAGGEILQSWQCTQLLEHFGVQLDAGVGAEYSGAAAGAFLGVARVRGAVGAEEKTRIAARHDRQQRLAIGFALEHRQAVVVRTDPAVE